MALKAILETLDDVPEAVRSEYKQVDGKFVLDIDGVDAHPTVVNLKTAFDRVKKERKEAVDKVKSFEERFADIPEDFDADEYHRLKEASDKSGKPDERLAQLREQLEKKHSTEKGRLEQEVSSLKGNIHRLVVDDGLTKALIDANVSKELLSAAKALMKEKGVIKLVEDEGKFDAVVDTDLGPMTLSKYVSEWASGDEGKVFVAKPTGADAKGGNSRVLGENPWAKDQRNLTKQQELIQSNPEKARQLAAAAGVKPTW